MTLVHSRPSNRMAICAAMLYIAVFQILVYALYAWAEALPMVDSLLWVMPRALGVSVLLVLAFALVERLKGDPKRVRTEPKRIVLPS